MTTTVIDRLTGRERQCAELFVRGMTSKQIAAKLFITVNTVRSHLARARDKLGVSSKLELRDILDEGQAARMRESCVPCVVQDIEDIARFLATQNLARRCSWEEAEDTVMKNWTDGRYVNARETFVNDAQRLVGWLGVRPSRVQPSART